MFRTGDDRIFALVNRCPHKGGRLSQGIVHGHAVTCSLHNWKPGDPECGWDGGDIRRALATGGVIGPSWSVVRRRTVLAVGGFDPSFHNCNDWDFYVRAGAAGARFVRIDDTLALGRTVTGPRLVEDIESGEMNALRVFGHPYCSGLTTRNRAFIDG